MSIQWQKPGVNHVGEFQVSGHMFPVTGSGAIIKLNYVASSITMGGTAGDVTFYDEKHQGMTVAMAAGSTVNAKFLTFNNAQPCFVTLTNIPSASYAPLPYNSASYGVFPPKPLQF